MERSKLLFLLIFIHFFAEGQQHRYACYLTDKDTTKWTESDPKTYLSSRSLQRRTKQNIPIIPQDYPVTEDYIETIEQLDLDVFFKSKWLNCLLIQGDTTGIHGLPFVSKVEYIAPGIKWESAKRINPKSDNDKPSFKEPVRVEASTTLQNNLLRADKMHKDGWMGEGMIIAVLDDGFEGVNKFTPFRHLFEDDLIVSSWDFISNSSNVFQYDDHGTKVITGLAANYEGQSNKVIGTAPFASYVLLVTEDYKSEYRVEEYNWLVAAEYADSIGVDIINSSLGYSDFRDKSMNYAKSDLDGETAIVSQAAQIVSSKGIVVVVSAGNEGDSNWKLVTAPADAKDVLAVGSTNSQGEKSYFSSFGPTQDGRIKPDVVALGELSTIMTGGGYVITGNGTSFASPQIAGLAAGIWQSNPLWTSSKVIESILLSSSNATTPDNTIGYGIPNYLKATNGSTLSAEDIIQNRFTVYPNPFEENRIYLDFGEVQVNESLEVRVINMNGAEVFSKEIEAGSRPQILEIAFTQMNKGAYVLQLENKTFLKQVKLVKI